VSLIDWVTVIRRYTPIVWYVVLTVLVGQIVTVLFAHRGDFQVDTVIPVLTNDLRESDNLLL
jgi:hypothetical protein